MKRFKPKLETLGIIFIIVFSGVIPIILMNYGKTNTQSEEDTQNNLLDEKFKV